MSNLRGFLTMQRGRLLLAPVAVAVAALAVLAIRAPTLPSGADTATPASPVQQGQQQQQVQPSALFLGDGFPAGTGAKDASTGAACLTAAAFGWVCNLDAQAGTGFVANGQANNPSNAPLAKRLAETRAGLLADIIVIDAGRDDGPEPAKRVRPAIRRYLRAVRAAWPRARLVVIEPYHLGTATAPLDRATLSVLRKETKRAHGVLIDPLGEGWIRPRRTAKLTTRDKVNPSPAGHRYLAEKLIADLRRLGLTKVPVSDRRGGAAG